MCACGFGACVRVCECVCEHVGVFMCVCVHVCACTCGGLEVDYLVTSSIVLLSCSLSQCLPVNPRAHKHGLTILLDSLP